MSLFQSKSKSKIKSEEEKTLHMGYMLILALGIGIIGGFGSIIFRAMIGFVHNLLFSGTLTFVFNTDRHIPVSVWGAGVIFVPVIGAVVVTWLTRTFAPEARGHGVPEVMDAIYNKKGRIRPVVAIVKAIASSISIGSGGSVGREGPIIQIGAAFGSTLGQIITMPARQRIILIAAGAGAGIAATFNAPIGGLAFAVELMLISISAASVALVAVATVTATVIGRLYIGLAPSFDIPSLASAIPNPLHWGTLLLVVPFGILIGLAAALFIRSIYWFEDHFEARIKNPYIRHMSGMFALGLLMYGFLLSSGHYYVSGVGYATIIDILKGTLLNPWFLIILFFAKLLATGLTLGSGASGGVFSPSLFLGATLGGAFGVIMNAWFPSLQISPALFAAAGMAAMVSGSTGAVITAITMTFEQTRYYAAVLPIMLSTALAYLVRIKLTSESIYTLKLSRRGQKIPQGLQAAITTTKRAEHLMSKHFNVIEKDQLDAYFENYDPVEETAYNIISENGMIMGLIRRELPYLIHDQKPSELIDTHFTTVLKDDLWSTLLRKMEHEERNTLLVFNTSDTLSADALVGVITPKELIQNSKHSAELIL